MAAEVEGGDEGRSSSSSSSSKILPSMQCEPTVAAAGCMMAAADHTPSRHEKSLGLLTTKFVSLLQEAKDGVLDLKVVSILNAFFFPKLVLHANRH